MRYKDFKKYRIASKGRFTQLYGFTIQYAEYKEALEQLKYLGSPDMSGMPHGGGVGNPTEDTGIRKAELEAKIKVIEECCMEADAEIYAALLIGVTTRNSSAKWLRRKGILFCGDDKYYLAKRKYFWLLDKRLGGMPNAGN